MRYSLHAIAMLALLAGCGKVESLSDAGSAFTVSIDSATAFIRRGEVRQFQVTVVRAGFTDSVTIGVANLPAGVVAEDLVIPGTDTSGTLTLTANNTAKEGFADLTISGTGGGGPPSDAALRLLVGGPPGTLDESFAVGGRFATTLALGARGIAFTSQGILATGFNSTLASTVRLTDAGVPDAAFGTAGFATSGTGEFSEGIAVTTLADGSVVVAGVVGGSGGSGDEDFAIHKYNSAGVSDAAFGSNGIAAFDPGNGFGELHTIAVDANGGLLVGGVLFPAGASIVGRVLRFSSTGVRDVAFNVTENATQILGSFLQPDGKLVLCGQLANNFWLARYNANGTKDAGFGVSGVITTSFGNDPSTASAVINVGGKLLAIGTAGPLSATHVVVARYNANSSLDQTFGVGGKVTTAAGFDTRSPNAAVVDSMGRILIVGFVGALPAVERLLPDGSMDPSFALAGVAPIDFGIAGQVNATGGYGIAIDADGRILFGGEVGGAGNQHMVVGRLWP